MTSGASLGQRVLLLAAALTPFTALRIGPAGPGEILFAVMFVAVFATSSSWRTTPTLAPILRFWAIFTCLTLTVYCVSVLFFGNQAGSFNGAVFDFTAYLVILCVMALFSQVSVFSERPAAAFFSSVFAAWAVIYTALYALSFLTPTLAGLPLKYYDYFSPLVDNIHQAAMITAAMPFIMWHLGASTRSRAIKLLCLAAGLLFIKMALDSGATKAMAGVVVGGVVALAAYLFQKFARNWQPSLRLAVLLVLGFIIIAIVFVKIDAFTAFAQRFFYDNDQSGARAGLYSIGLSLAMESIVFGYGPGPHIAYALYGGYSDAHNTTLTLLLQGGIIAVGLFYYAAYRAGRAVMSSPFLIGALCSIGIYFLGGDILRRLPIWIMLAGVLYLAEADARARESRQAETS